jgi:integrase
MDIDIHQFARGYDRALANLDRQPISERNKQLIRGYCQACLLRQVCGKVRLASAITTLTKFARLFAKDFDQVTRADLERAIGLLLQHQPPYSVLTISVQQKLLRRFLLYVSAPDQFPTIKTFPESIAWMSGHVRRRDRPSLQRSDLLTPSEIDQLLRATNYARDRAFISALWEAGPRVSEIGNMHIKDAVPSRTGTHSTSPARPAPATRS